MGWIETRAEMLKRLIDARTADEAERYKDKQVDEPVTKPEPAPEPDGYVRFKHQIDSSVRMRHSEEPGIVTALVIRAGGLAYVVKWVDSKAEVEHYEFELEALPADEAPI